MNNSIADFQCIFLILRSPLFYLVKYQHCSNTTKEQTKMQSTSNLPAQMQDSLHNALILPEWGHVFSSSASFSNQTLHSIAVFYE